MSLKGRLYDLMMAPWERLGFARRRGDLLGGLAGRVLELGVGTGLNLPCYPEGARVVAIDPQLCLLEHARRRGRSRQHLVCARAEALPFRDAVFDAAVGTLVLCTVEAPGRGLDEVIRTLKSGGELRVIEHVRWRRRPWLGRLQDGLAPAWKIIADGCHLNRDTERIVRDAGFSVAHRREDLGGLLLELRARSVSRSPDGSAEHEVGARGGP